MRSPFTDLASVGQIHYPYLPARALLKDRFPVAEYVARVAVPITVVYGTEDSIVPPGESRRSVAVAGGPTRLVAVEGADHNDLALLNGDVVVQAVVDQAIWKRRYLMPQACSFVHIDAVAATVAAIERGARRVYNIFYEPAPVNRVGCQRCRP